MLSRSIDELVKAEDVVSLAYTKGTLGELPRLCFSGDFLQIPISVLAGSDSGQKLGVDTPSVIPINEYRRNVNGMKSV